MKRKGATLQRTAIAVLSILLAVSIGVTAGATSYRTLICNAIGGEMYRLEGGDDSDTIQLYETNGMTLEEGGFCVSHDAGNNRTMNKAGADYEYLAII